MNARARAAAAAAAMSVPLALEGGTSPLLQRAWAAYREQAQRAAELAACKLELLQYYDVPAMQRAVNICYWGRSGSFLLASYLDGHDQAVMLPQECAAGIYPFWGEFASLTVWEKLLTYPTYVTNKYGPSVDFFAGEYAIESVHYYAAVHALFVAYGDRPGAWLDTRQRFFQLLHVAYALARGQRPADPRPLIVYAQHKTDEELAQLFRADFPQGLFIHTIRDPISTVDSWFERQVAMQSEVRGHRLDVALRYVHPATETMRTLLRSDRPYLGWRSVPARYASRICTCSRRRPCGVWRRGWGLPFVPPACSRAPSTAVLSCGGTATSPGSGPIRATHSGVQIISIARLHADLRAAAAKLPGVGLPMPRAFRSKTLCLARSGLLWLLPMKIERITAQLIVGRQAWPALRRGKGALCLRGRVFSAHVARAHDAPARQGRAAQGSQANAPAATLGTPTMRAAAALVRHGAGPFR